MSTHKAPHQNPSDIVTPAIKQLLQKFPMERFAAVSSVVLFLAYCGAYLNLNIWLKMFDLQSGNLDLGTTDMAVIGFLTVLIPTGLFALGLVIAGQINGKESKTHIFLLVLFALTFSIVPWLVAPQLLGVAGSFWIGFAFGAAANHRWAREVKGLKVFFLSVGSLVAFGSNFYGLTYDSLEVARGNTSVLMAPVNVSLVATDLDKAHDLPVCRLVFFGRDSTQFQWVPSPQGGRKFVTTGELNGYPCPRGSVTKLK
jgi:hypothetical protein